ncbi:MAG: histidine--tRNA ligase [Acidimicrobiales bacterium]
MAQPTFQSLKGMHDLMPPESARWLELVRRFGEQFARAGYAYVQTPVLEELAVFARVGEGTDVVTKEMYDFDDRDGTRIALRPESTAGVARAFIQHRPPAPWKVWYSSQHFRHENTQAGRYRQHHQLGAECFGSDHPDIDVELIVGLWDFYATSLGLQRITLQLNSIGDPAARGRFQEVLRGYFRDRVDELHPTDREKIDRNPMRVLDSKFAESAAVVAEAPRLADQLSDADAARHEAVQRGLAEAGVPFELNPRLVRGLDYYTHTVFEIVSDAMDAAQSTIGGGGRYDGLVESLGGPPTPGFGFGTGIERVLLACDAEELLPLPRFAIDAFVVTFDRDEDAARRLCLELRRAGVGVDRALNQHNPRKQADRARRAGARFIVRLGKDDLPDGTVEVVDEADDSRFTVDRATLAEELRSRR